MTRKAPEDRPPQLASAPGPAAAWAARLVFPAAVAATLLRFWLASAQALEARAGSVHDDQLYAKLANELIHGRWLGTYDKLTLAKGPFYSFWIAAAFKTGIPLLLSEQLLYTAACALLAGIALRPAIPGRGIRLLLYLLLLFNPISLNAPVGTYVLREGVYPALSLLVLACLYGLLHQWKLASPPWGWAIALGLSSAAFWTTREEGAWLLPAALTAITLAVLLDRTGLGWRRPVALLGASLGVAIACWSALAAGNLRHYGRFVVVEYRDDAFPAAYGALCRIKHAPAGAWLHIPKDARERAYEVSPAFSRLRSGLEGPIGTGWTTLACRVWKICDDMPAGFLMWAIRDAAQAQGIHASAATAAAYYQQVAREIDAACADGRLRCGPSRVSMMPPWRNEFLGATLRQSARALSFVARFEDAPPSTHQRSGTPGNLAMFRHVSRERLDGDAPARPSATARLEALGWIGRAYGLLTPWLLATAAVGYLAALAIAVRRRRLHPLLGIATVALAGFLSRLVVVALVEVTSFTAIHNVYLSPAHPFMLLFVFASIAAVLVGRGEPGQPA